jgi:hypothetical protein
MSATLSSSLFLLSGPFGFLTYRHSFECLSVIFRMIAMIVGRYQHMVSNVCITSV